MLNPKINNKKQSYSIALLNSIKDNSTQIEGIYFSKSKDLDVYSYDELQYICERQGGFNG